MDRRAFLSRGALAGGVLLLGACSDEAAAPSASTTTTSTSLPSTPTIPYDASKPYWLQGGFAPVTEEVFARDLVVNGALPPSLNGLYTRNGSNPVTGQSPHWFFGDGMIHGVRFENGKAVSYRNRYVQTPMYVEQREFGDFSGIPGFAETQSNVSIFAHGGRLLSLGEVGAPYEISADDLSTVGVVQLTGAAGAVGGNVTAHPKRDPANGLLHFFGYGFTPPYLTYYVASADGRELLVREEIDVAAGTMVHDFAITESDVVFWELPVVFDLGGPAADMRWVEIDNGYVFHGANAWRDGDQIMLDVSCMDSMFDHNSEGSGDLDENLSILTRWEIDTSGADLTWSATPLSDVPLDLPEIDDRYTGRKHSVAWLVETNDTAAGNVEINGIAAVDPTTGSLDRWTPGPLLQPNEVTFVADSPESGEGEGWLLTYVWDKTTDESSLAVLDATNVSAGPVAAVDLPQRVPFGFHGTWLEAE